MIKAIIRNLLKPLSFLPAILMMYLIFSFSAQDGNVSAQLSYKVSYKIVEVAADVIGADFEPWEIESLANRFHGPIRKIAHMAEYFALAVSISFPLYVYGLRGFLLLIIAGLFCVGFACADEYHQSMVAGRSPSKKDVMIDSIGIFCGIIFTRIVGWTGRKTIFRPLAKKKKKNMQQGYAVPDAFAPDTQPAYNRPAAPGPYMAPGYNNYPYNNYPNSNYQNHNYSNQPPYPGRPNSDTYYQSGVSNQKGNHYYETLPYDYPPQRPNNDSTSDRLSEDMSFKKLMSDLKNQKKTERHLSHKPKLHESDLDLFDDDSYYETNELQIDEINLND